jgi:hypothetical protein
MSRSETEFELEARIVALEYLLKQCLWNILVMKADQELADDPDGDETLPIREARLFRKNAVAELKKASFSGTDPSLSDHLAAIVHDAVERVCEELVSEMEAELGPGRS